MSKLKPINTDVGLAAAIGDLFDNDTGPETEEEIDYILRASGHDPDDVGNRTCAFVDGLIQEARSELAINCETESKHLTERLAQVEPPPTRVGLIQAIQEFIMRRGPEMATQFRNFEQQTDDDLRELFTELIILDQNTEDE